MDAPQDIRFLDQGLADGNINNLDDAIHRVDEVSSKVDTLEQKLNVVEQFYSTTNKKQSNNSKGGSIVRDKEKEKYAATIKKRQLDAERREAAATKRRQDLVRKFGTILRQLTQHKWAGPFRHPVDVEGLGLHDYFEVIEKPMDFSTIKTKMEAKDGNGYKNVREMCADVRLIFENAMKYNNERDDVHIMAKTLLEKFEVKWRQLLPKVDEEEKRRKDEVAEVHLHKKLSQEAANAKMVLDLSNELDEVDRYLGNLRDMLLQKCRRMSPEEKRQLGTCLSELSTEDLRKALQIIAQSNPNFQASTDEVDLDMDAQSESTLWKLKLFTIHAIENKGKTGTSVGDDTNKTTAHKRKTEMCDDDLAKTSSKKLAQ